MIRFVAIFCLIALLMCMVMTQLSSTLTVTRAALPKESHAAAVLYNLGPVLYCAGTLIGLLAVIASLVSASYEFRRRDSLATSALCSAAALMVAVIIPLARGWFSGLSPEQMPLAGSFIGGGTFILLTIACGLWMLSSWDDRYRRMETPGGASATRRLNNCLSGVKAGQILSTLPSFILLACLASVFVSVLETSLHTLTAVQNCCDTYVLGQYWLVSLSAAVLFGIEYGLMLAMVVGGIWLVVHLVGRFSQNKEHVSSLAGIAAALLLYHFVRHGVAQIFEDEIVQLGLGTGATCATVIGAMFYGTLVSWNLTEFCRRKDRPRDLTDLILLTLMSGVLVVAGPLARIFRRNVSVNLATRTLACLITACIGGSLLWVTFPSLVDHTSRADILWATWVTLAAVYLMFLVLTPRSRWWPGVLAAVVILIAGSSVVMATVRNGSAVRLMLYRYSAIARSHLECSEWCFDKKRNWDAQYKPLAPPMPVVKPVKSEVLDNLRAKKPLIVFVILDACRPDRMSLYGYKRKTTPYLDSMKDDLIRFTNAFSQSTATSCSMRNFFTGRYSSRFMLQKKGIGPFFVNDLLRAGYHTLHLNIIGSDYNGISAEAFLRDMPDDLKNRLTHVKYDDLREKLYGKGRQVKQAHSHIARAEKDKLLLVSYGEQSEPKKIPVLLDYLDNHQAAGTFAYIHMTATHSPWRQYTEAPNYGTGEHNVYDSTVTYCDQVLETLVEGLKKRGLMDNTVLIISADHGTGLGEHGQFGGFYPYREQINIPLIMRIPGVKGREIDSLTGLFDVGPTLVAALTDEPIERYDGINLWPSILNGFNHEPRVLFGLNAFANCYFLVSSDGTHYICHRDYRYETIFNYKNDPAEKRLLLNDEAALKKSRRQMVWFLQNGKGRYTNPYHYRAE